MSKIHSDQSIKANWQVAMHDGKVTEEEARQIVDAAKNWGVSKQELREAGDLVVDAFLNLLSADVGHSVVKSLLKDRVDRDGQLSEGLLEVRRESGAEVDEALANADSAHMIKDHLVGARAGQNAAHSISLDMGVAVTDFGRWTASMFGGDD